MSTANHTLSPKQLPITVNFKFQLNQWVNGDKRNTDVGYQMVENQGRLIQSLIYTRLLTGTKCELNGVGGLKQRIMSLRACVSLSEKYQNILFHIRYEKDWRTQLFQTPRQHQIILLFSCGRPYSIRIYSLSVYVVETSELPSQKHVTCHMSICHTKPSVILSYAPRFP